MTRSVLFDTETTGLDPLTGDRVIEIAALELENDLPTGRHFHRLIDPGRDIPPEASRVHGITAADLAGKPDFSAIADDMLAFFGDGKLIAHNAAFDFGFIDAELLRIGGQALDRARMIDTLAMAKARFPGLPNSLDALCRRFGIDLTARTTHNALLDCKLLAEVYVELTGGRQRGLSLATAERQSGAALAEDPDLLARPPRRPRPARISAAEEEAHAAFLGRLKDPLWRAG